MYSFCRIRLWVLLVDIVKVMISDVKSVSLYESVSLNSHKRVDIYEHLARCEANFARIHRLLIDHLLNGLQSREIHFRNGAPPIEFRLHRISKHTSYLMIRQQAEQSHLNLFIKVNIYHDVRSAEVAPLQTFRQLHVLGFKQGPMSNRLEKMEMNRFLSELLDYCLAQGRVNRLEEITAEKEGNP